MGSAVLTSDSFIQMLDAGTAAAKSMTEGENPERPAFEMRYGKPLYQYAREDKETSARFALAMSDRKFGLNVQKIGDVVLSRYPQGATVVDVGGGVGHTAMALAHVRLS